MDVHPSGMVIPSDSFCRECKLLEINSFTEGAVISGVYEVRFCGENA
jgi:hypothetical protein